MELTILLSKVFGVYLIIGGLAYIIRRKYFMAVVHELIDDRGLRMVVAVSELAAGLFLINTHNIWDSWPTGLVSIVGWLLAIEGVFYLFTPERFMRKVLKAFNTKAWYIIGGLLSLIGGIYLINFGYALGWF